MSIDDDDESSGWPLTRTMIENAVKVWQTILKTEDEWFMMFATLSGVVWNVPVNFVGLAQHAAQGSKICTKADKQWSKRNTALLSALTSRNRPNINPPSTPSSSLVTNLGYDPETKQQVISEEDSNFTMTEESMTSSEQCPINVDLFFWHWKHHA